MSNTSYTVSISIIILWVLIIANFIMMAKKHKKEDKEFKYQIELINMLIIIKHGICYFEELEKVVDNFPEEIKKRSKSFNALLTEHLKQMGKQ